ncbi:L-rhamnose/proton symporter RhaT [Pseudozobellia thermophila]|uniref:L-rhamnose-H+ transport protein n=1 Tax=Pseudozobellia thermophila TaxID=192903 RepID=A0A1M6GMK4_9FLAO|nr:L-rhamnose/proton symporter RhaT [Pseudozobellia thermophila]SHJ11169.1 L-rhamnose-H+ transport protein [Pseudozobellia thermophila]
MDNSLLAISLVILASFFQGTFGLGMKYMSPLKWEAWWLVHALIAMIVVPIVWALILMPNLFEIIAQTRGAVVWEAALYGFLWGIGGILFGVSVEKTGISITYGIVMGLAASMGSIIPLFQIDGALSNPSFPIVLLGVLLLLVGVAVTAIAGVKRDNLKTDGLERNNNIKLGVLIAVLSGILSAFLNVGFANASPVAQVAVNEFGVAPQEASLAAWVVVLLGAFAMNGGYAIIRLLRNKTFASFGEKESGKAYMWAVLSGVFWFAALGVYGQGAALMGDMGPVIGWPILLGLALIISNIWAYRSGEWKNAKAPFKLLLFGLAILIIAVCILGYSNY